MAIVLHDIIVTTRTPHSLPLPIYPVGEFINPRLFGGRPAIKDEAVFAMLERLCEYIYALIGCAAKYHQKENCMDSQHLKPDRQNHVTRLITSEFLFYTK